MTLLSIGDCVKPGTYRLHSCFEQAVNYERRGRLVSVVGESVGPGPLNIVIRALPAAREHPQRVAAGILPAVRAGLLPPGAVLESSSVPAMRKAMPPGRMPAATAQGGSRQLGGCESAMPRERLRLEVGADTVLFAGYRYHFTSRQRYDSTLELPAVDLRRFRRNLATFSELLRKTAPPHSLAFLLDSRRLRFFGTGFERAFAAQIRRGVQRAFHGDLLKGVADMKGCGVGLTPSGDDFIAGLLTGLNFLQKLHGQSLQPIADAVCRAAQGSSLFSNTALELARQGLLFGRLKELLMALVSGNALSLRHATRKLLAVGASSGADLGTGFFMTVNDQGNAAERWKTEASARAGKARWKTEAP